MEDRYYIGTELKFAFTITADGFDMDTDDYEITLSCGGKRLPVPKEDIVDGEDGHYLLVDTSQFPSGTLRMVVTAQVPDDDFGDGMRAEVAALDLCIIQHPW